jgi:hypothetical protein
MSQNSYGGMIKPKVCYFCGNLSRESLGEWHPPRTLAQVEQDAKKSECQACLMLCWIASDFVSGTKLTSLVIPRGYSKPDPDEVIRSMKVDTKVLLANNSDSPITLLIDLGAVFYGAEVRRENISLQIFGTLGEWHDPSTLAR